MLIPIELPYNIVISPRAPKTLTTTPPNAVGLAAPTLDVVMLGAAGDVAVLTLLVATENTLPAPDVIVLPTPSAPLVIREPTLSALDVTVLPNPSSPLIIFEVTLPALDVLVLPTSSAPLVIFIATLPAPEVTEPPTATTPLTRELQTDVTVEPALSVKVKAKVE